MNRPSTSRPTTPIRRISRGSVSALAFSQSQHDAFETDPLAHLEPLFTELADSLEILSDNFSHLNHINDNLDDFNETFASFLYGLRLNAYSTDFTQAPSKLSFDLLKKRKERVREDILSDKASTVSDAEENDAIDGGVAGDATAHSIAAAGEMSMASSNSRIARPTSTAPSTRGGKVTATRGGKAAQIARKKEKNMQFVLSVIDTLEIKYREEQPFRAEMEQILMILKDNPDGLYIPDVVSKSSPPIAKHRVNAALNSLLRSKHVLKIANKGLLYKLDPVRHPSR